MRYVVVAGLLVLNGLLIYLFGSSVGFSSSLITLILILAFLAVSLGGDGIWPRRRDPGEPNPEVNWEDEETVRHSRGRIP